MFNFWPSVYAVVIGNFATIATIVVCVEVGTRFFDWRDRRRKPSSHPFQHIMNQVDKDRDAQ